MTFDRAALPAMDVADRPGRLRDRLDGAGCEALLVTDLTNVRYLTGFTGSAGIVLVAPDDLLFVSDGRYRDQAAEELDAAGVPARIEIVPPWAKNGRTRRSASTPSTPDESIVPSGRAVIAP